MSTVYSFITVDTVKLRKGNTVTKIESWATICDSDKQFFEIALHAKFPGE